jgi:hypothetical protein
VDGRLYATPESDARELACGLAWLWRLGPLLDDPDVRAVGIGTNAEAGALDALARAGRLAAAVVFVDEQGDATPPLPARRHVTGVARFAPSCMVDGRFLLLDGVSPTVASSLGVHAGVVDGRTLVVGASSATAWTLLHQFWSLEAVARFLIEKLERPLVALPPVGCVRLDDAPGTAQHQIEGNAHSDHRQARRIHALARTYAGRDAVLNLAVSARALAPDLRTEIPLQDRWPTAVQAIARGVGRGAFEPVGHGYLHLDRVALDRGVVEKHEFANLDLVDAYWRIEAALEWHEQSLGRMPRTFVAPAWGYSEGTLSALKKLDVTAWRRPSLGPLRGNGSVRETLDSAFRGLRGLDLMPLVTLASYGRPPTPVLHGALFDLRLEQLRSSRDVATAARLLVRRDIARLPSLPGVRWIGAGDLVRLLDEHGTIEVRGEEVSADDAPGARLLTNESRGQAAVPARRRLRLPGRGAVGR